MPFAVVNVTAPIYEPVGAPVTLRPTDTLEGAFPDDGDRFTVTLGAVPEVDGFTADNPFEETVHAGVLPATSGST